MSDFENSTVVTIVALIPPAAGRVDDVRRHLIKLAEETKKNEPGALRYELAEQADAAGEPEFVVIEDYKDEAAHKEHENSEHFQAFFKAVQTESLLKEGTAIKVLKKFGGFSSK